MENDTQETTTVITATQQQPSYDDTPVETDPPAVVESAVEVASAVVEQAPAEQPSTPVVQVSAEQAPAAEAPVEQPPVAQAVEQPPVEEAPAVQTPVTDTTVGQSQPETTQQPAVEVPVQDAPVPAPVPVEETAPVVQAPAPVQDPVEAPEATPVVATTSSELSAQSQHAINGLHEYVEKMKHIYPSYLTLGGQYQQALYSHLVKILHTGEEEFETVLSHALQIIKDNLGGVFHERFMARYANQTKLAADEASHLHHLLTGLVALADPVTREAQKVVVNVEKMLPLHKIAEEARDRVKSFFNF